MAIHHSLLLFALSLLLVHSHARLNDRQHRESTEEWLSECINSCPQSSPQEVTQCAQQCIQQYVHQGPGRSPDLGGLNRLISRSEEEEEEETRTQTQSRNPFYFSSQRFRTKFQSEHGSIRLLQSFIESSDLLRGLGNYRLKILEADPQTLVRPYHNDAGSIFVAVAGEGTITYLWPQTQRNSFKLRAGQAIRVPPGAVFYFVNHNNNQRLRVLELSMPLDVPGRVQEFFPVGGQRQESYLTSFNKELLEAAFKAQWNELQSVLGPDNSGEMMKISREQVRALTQEPQSESKQQREVWSPIDVLEERVVASNEYGRHVEASPEDHNQLQGVDISIGLMNITGGAMTPPYYNTRATKAVYVNHGQAQVYVVTPYLNNQEQRQHSGVQYRRVEAHVKEGDVFVVPEGHPLVIVADPNSNLELVSIGFRGSFNQKFFLAGAENMWTQLQPELLDLILGRGWRGVVKRQSASQFVPGPYMQRKPRFVGSF